MDEAWLDDSVDSHDYLVPIPIKIKPKKQMSQLKEDINESHS
jgi:hypothetical protein